MSPVKSDLVQGSGFPCEVTKVPRDIYFHKQYQQKRGCLPVLTYFLARPIHGQAKTNNKLMMNRFIFKLTHNG